MRLGEPLNTLKPTKLDYNRHRWLSEYLNEMTLNPSHPPSLSIPELQPHVPPTHDRSDVASEPQPTTDPHSVKHEAKEPLFLPSPSSSPQQSTTQNPLPPIQTTPARRAPLPPPSLPPPSFAPTPVIDSAKNAAAPPSPAGQRAWLPPPSFGPDSSEWKSLNMPVVPRGGPPAPGSGTSTLKKKAKKRVGVEQ